MYEKRLSNKIINNIGILLKYHCTGLSIAKVGAKDY
jgi:hypothetical protein